MLSMYPFLLDLSGSQALCVFKGWCVHSREGSAERGWGLCRAEGWSWRGKRRDGDLGEVTGQRLGKGAGVAREKALRCVLRPLGPSLLAGLPSLSSSLSPTRPREGSSYPRAAPALSPSCLPLIIAEHWGQCLHIASAMCLSQIHTYINV